MLTILLEQSVGKLLTVTDPDAFRAVQAEANTYQKLLDYQQKPPLNLTK